MLLEHQTNIKIRYAKPEDLDSLITIYSHYVLNTFITFEYTVPSKEEFTDRMNTIQAKFPYLVATIHDEVVGYAYASTFKGRSAYDWTVETSIYVDSRKHGLQIGTYLYESLEQLLQKQNICNLCACIAYPNPESIAFHEKFGYKTIAHFTNSGFKHNQWIDMIWMEKFINDHIIPPKPFIPITNLGGFHE